MFDFENLIVTDNDIELVENHFGFKFNDGQKKVIRHWESCDIQACPGSGKTTTLAAKLIILANKIPIGYSRGICVITHTNIAVEEIRSKLGDYAAFYFRYPNHFGTIQSFVDKYLAIPAYKNEFKRTPNIVDPETYHGVISKNNLLRVTGTQRLLEFNDIDLGYDLSFNRHNFEISKSINASEKFQLRNISAVKYEPHYKRIMTVKQQLLADGYLKYDEAYSLAFKYLRGNPELPSYFKLRFPVVFIDEMQDMELHQSNLIDQLFSKETCVLQKIGDTNQSIYSRSESSDEIEWKPLVSATLQLVISNRISHHIANLVKDICMVPQQMEGWQNANPIIPTIIVYDNNSILQVKDVFAKKVLENDLNQKGLVKCIGSRIGVSKLFINSYWPDFNRKKIKTEFNNLVSHLNLIGQKVSYKYNVKEIYQSFIRIFCTCLKMAGVRNPFNQFYFTPYSLIQNLKQLDDHTQITSLNSVIAEWLSKVAVGDDIKDAIADYAVKLVTYFNGDEKSIQLASFLNDLEIEESIEKTELKIYNYRDGDKSVDLHFDTIHGVKGETHAATLYMETYLKQVYDVGGKILNFIIADDKGKAKHRKDAACKKRLPLAYVAITRATDYIAIAVHKDRYSKEHHDYFEMHKDKWEVMNLS